MIQSPTVGAIVNGYGAVVGENNAAGDIRALFFVARYSAVATLLPVTRPVQAASVVRMQFFVLSGANGV